MGTRATQNDGGEVVSVEEYLAKTVAEADNLLNAAKEARDQLALRLHALQMASDARVDETVDDYERRVKENRPYEDATSVDDLIAEARSRL